MTPHSTKTRILILVRHGESEANRAGTFDGYADAALTELGRRQATLAGARLAALLMDRVRVVSSPLRRAAHTAQAIASTLGTTVRVDSGLVAGEGRPGQSLETAGAEVTETIRAAWADWDGALIAVSHRFPLRAYLQRLYGADSAASLVDALGNGDALEVRFQAEVAHAAIHHRLVETTLGLA
jgi:broad specificity phosphatase PhoE